MGLFILGGHLRARLEPAPSKWLSLRCAACVLYGCQKTDGVRGQRRAFAHRSKGRSVRGGVASVTVKKRPVVVTSCTNVACH
jgi:hypothetical protein